jgi:benzoylformate decarboxylase
VTARLVRDAAFDVMRRQGMTSIFSNPGSTEVSFLVDLPDDISFVLALHEASVVGIATGWALAARQPAFVLLHTAAGLGNAVGAIATARVNRAPLVIVVGQQDRRHLALWPFLAGELDGLAGDYPLDVIAPVRAQDVPSAIERAAHRARRDQGPVVVIVPMDDWLAIHEPDVVAAARSVVEARPTAWDVADLTALVAAARTPVIVAGAGNDSKVGWSALVALAERIDAPVWQEAFGGRAGFPQDHPLFRGHLPADRPGVREALAGADLVLVIGAAALRQYPYAEGPLVPAGASIVVVTADAAEAERSPAELAVIGEPADVVAALVAELAASGAPARRAHTERRATMPAVESPAPGSLKADDEAISPVEVFTLLGRLLPEDTVLVEESPSSRPLLHALVPARKPLGFVSAAMGGLGFALPASIGIKRALPHRPVVAVVGDGSAMYAIQSLWTAVHLRIGVLYVVMANGRYAVMDRLAEQVGGKPPWPTFPEVSVGGMAESLGCRVVKVDRRDALETVLTESTSALRRLDHPLVVEIAVASNGTVAR